MGINKILQKKISGKMDSFLPFKIFVVLLASEDTHAVSSDPKKKVRNLRIR